MSKTAEREVVITSLNVLRCTSCSFYTVNRLVFALFFFFVKISQQKEAKIRVVSPEKSWTSLLRKFKLTLD